MSSLQLIEATSMEDDSPCKFSKEVVLYVEKYEFV